MRRFWSYILGFLLAALLGGLLAVSMKADNAPVLSGSTELLTLHFTPGQSYGCMVWTSEGQPGYSPLKCVNIPADASSWMEDWSYINCRLDGPPYCPDGDWWTVKAFVQRDLPNGEYSEPVYSNSLRLKWTK